MQTLRLEGYYVNGLLWGGEEHLHQRDYESADKAILDCLCTDVRVDYLLVIDIETGLELGELHPNSEWDSVNQYGLALDCIRLVVPRVFGEDADVSKDALAEQLIRNRLQKSS